MTKEERIKGYIDRIKTEITYKNYAEAKSLCIRVINLDDTKIDVLRTRDYLEKLQRYNGRYKAFDVHEYISFLSNNYQCITARNVSKMELFIWVLAQEMPDDDSYFYTSEIEKLKQVNDYFANVITETNDIELENYVSLLEGLKKIIKLTIESQEREAKERELKEEQERIRKRNNIIIGVYIVIMFLISAVVVAINKSSGIVVLTIGVIIGIVAIIMNREKQ